MLISAVQQSDSLIHTYIYIYIYILFHILFHYGLSQDIGYSSLCFTVEPCCLSILYIIVRKCTDCEMKEPCGTHKFLCQIILALRKYLLYLNAQRSFHLLSHQTIFFPPPTPTFFFYSFTSRVSLTDRIRRFLLKLSFECNHHL